MKYLCVAVLLLLMACGGKDDKKEADKSKKDEAKKEADNKAKEEARRLKFSASMKKLIIGIIKSHDDDGKMPKDLDLLFADGHIKKDTEAIRSKVVYLKEAKMDVNNSVVLISKIGTFKDMIIVGYTNGKVKKFDFKGKTIEEAKTFLKGK